MKLNVTPVFAKTKTLYDGGQYRQIVSMGGSRCFHANQLIVTDKGSKAISDIKKGDKVLTYNEETNSNEFKEVFEPLYFPNNKKPAFKITLKNGSVITVTKDHEFFYRGNWVRIEELLSLRNK